ncbi:MAG: hypothetical protein FJZ90_00095 [Chloroflexi bacterium]|nr:hypothetical protein [Chloroflexota bacterium]
MVTIIRPESRVLTIGNPGLRILSGPMGGGLLNNLIAYWPGNEPNGDLLDAHINGLHLTDTNTVTSAAGIVYPTARFYQQVNGEYHRRVDEPLLSTGDVDFTLAVWLYRTFRASVVDWGVIGKYTSSAREYVISWEDVTERMQFSVSRDGGVGTVTGIQATTFGVVPLDTWIFVIAWHDAVLDRIYIQVNNGTADWASHANGVFDGTAQFEIGRFFSMAETTWNGRIGPSAFWKSAPGGSGVLTAAQRTALWNGGAGLPYTAFTT